jgi:stage III sporulation protein AF
MILNAIIMNLLGNSSYKKYVSIVSGMILVLIVVSPLMKYLKMEDSLDYYLQSNEFSVETSDFENDLKYMEEKQLEEVYADYQERVRSQVETILLGEQLTLKDFSLTLDRDPESSSFGTILGMNITAVYDSPKEVQQERIRIEDIELSGIGQASEKERKAPVNAPSPAEISIKIKLSDFYNIEPDNINISIQGG